MRAAGSRTRHVLAATGWLTLLAPLAIILLSVARSPQSNWIVRVALGAFVILAIARPAAAFLVSIALVAFGSVIAHLIGAPSLRVSEVLVVALLAAACLRALEPGSAFRETLTRWISVPIVLFAATAAASAVVWQRVQQFQTGYPAVYFEALRQFVTRDYFHQTGAFSPLVSTMVILEGLGLYVVAAALCQLDTSFFRRSLRMLAVGGAGLAVVSAYRIAEVHLRNPGAISALREAGALRISPVIPDVIAAGSYFALCGLAVAGLAVGRSRERWAWIASAVPIVGALYLTGSRSVVAAALVGLAALFVISLRYRRAAASRAGLFALAALVAMVVSFPLLTGRDVAGELARQSLVIRAELIKTGMRVVATRPLFGVGLDRFYLTAGGLASPELQALWPERKNPHNDLLRIAGELGLVGAGLVLWILGAVTVWAVRALKTRRDLPLAGLACGLLALLVTTFGSNPLVFPEVSYVFWMAVGLLAGESRVSHSPNEIRNQFGSITAGVPRIRASTLKWSVAIVLVGVLAATVPFRARRELAGLNVNRVRYGLYDPTVDPDGTPTRWSGPSATIFVNAKARLVEIPLSGTLPSGAAQEVEIRVDGRLANRVTVGPEWRRVTTLLPPTSSIAPRRIDLAISPTWVPSEVLPGNHDTRVLGVKVGEIKVAYDPGT